MNLKKVIIVLVVLIIAIIIILVLKEKFKSGYKRLVYGTQGDEPYAHVTDARKLEIEKLAEDIYEVIYRWFADASDKATQFNLANGLNDAEFKYLNEYYNKFVTDNTLYYDVDWEVLAGDSDDKLLARIKRMNLQQ